MVVGKELEQTEEETSGICRYEREQNVEKQKGQL